MDDKKKKKYIIPEAEIIELSTGDIITWSNGGEFPDDWEGEDWEVA